MRSSSPGDAGRYGSTSFRERAPQTPRKRMMALGRKAHFMHDAKIAITRPGGGLEEQHARAFLESVFQKGSRQSTEAARLFLDEKLGDQTLGKEQHAMLARLIEQYSFWR